MKKRTIKIITVALIVILAGFVLCSCTLSEKKLVGTWESDGSVYLSKYGCACTATLTFSESGEFLKVLYKASTGSVVDYTYGTWEIEKKTVYVSIPGQLGRTTYEYKNGKLTSGDWTFEK